MTFLRNSINRDDLELYNIVEYFLDSRTKMLCIYNKKDNNLLEMFPKFENLKHE